MKLGYPDQQSDDIRREAEINTYLSNSEQSRDHTAKPHPRYPYLQWNMDNDTHQKVAVVITARLTKPEDALFSKPFPLTKLHNQASMFRHIDEILSEDTAACWADVMSVMKRLWTFRDGHYLDNDVHHEQIIYVGGQGGERARCCVIDFGMVFSLDERKVNARHSFANPFWHSKLRNEPQRIDYIREHGLEEFHKRGWEFSVTRWGQTIFMERLVTLVYGINPYPKMADKDTDIINAKWCQTAELVEKLVGKLKELREAANTGTRPAINDAAFHQVLEQSMIIKSGIKAIDCSTATAAAAAGAGAATAAAGSEAVCKPWCKGALKRFTRGNMPREKLCGNLKCRGCAFSGSPCNK